MERTDISKGITSNMDWSLLENAICVLTLAKEEEMDQSNRAAIQCALFKAYLTRFCCLGWVEDDETAERLLAEDGVPKELMVSGLALCSRSNVLTVGSGRSMG